MKMRGMNTLDVAFEAELPDGKVIGLKAPGLPVVGETIHIDDEPYTVLDRHWTLYERDLLCTIEIGLIG